jgi:hypothetical protein
MVNRSDATTRVVSEDVTLSGEGIRSGSSVTLPNSGGQWANQYTQAELDVQVVGPTQSGVVAESSRLVGEINASLAAAQGDQHVDKHNLIRTQLSPPTAIVYRQSGSRSRAGIATLVLGCGVTAAAAAMARRRARRKALTAI